MDPAALEHLKGYIAEGVSAFQVIAHTARLLREAGFVQLPMKASWRLEAGGRYFVTPFGTTLYAFTLGEESPLDGRPLLSGAHVDFPAIKIGSRIVVPRDNLVAWIEEKMAQ